MKVLYFGIYNPDYARNRVLIKGFKQNGVEVLECRTKPAGFFPFIKLFFKYWKFSSKYDFMLVGFPGQEAMFLARFLTRKPIIFDAFTSHFGGYVLDRQYYSPGSFRAKYYRFLDKWSCRLADLVLLDTNTHIDFFVREFGLPREKFRRIFVGADSDIFYPHAHFGLESRDSKISRSESKVSVGVYPRNGKKRDDKFLVHPVRSHGRIPRPASFGVHFHGHYIPFQGVRYIIKAAQLLENQNVFFNLIGRGQTFEEDRKLAERLGLKNINFIDSVPYNKLPDYMAKADICLGIFGDSPKTELVIPNKVFEAIAMAKPVITADTSAIRELFTDRENIFLCRRRDPRDLADAILQLRKNDELRHRIADSAYKLFKNRVSEDTIGADLEQIVSSI